MTNLSSTNFSSSRATITNLSSTNFSTTLATIINLSGTNASFTTLTASNIQPLLTAGNNIQLVGPILSTTPNVNVSNLSCINLSATDGAFTILRELDPNLGLEIFSYQITTEELYATDVFTENVRATDKIIIQTALPTLYFRDTDHIAGAIQQNNDLMAFRATSNVGGPLVLTRTMFQINCSTDDALFYGNVSVTEKLQSVGLVSTNASLTNLSGVNASFTYLTADNLQETLIAGPGIAIVDRTISTQQILVAGNNIQIIDETISTTPSINVSNLSSINLSADSGFIYTFEADTIETIGLNSQGIFADEADITTVRAINVDTNALTCLTGTITNLSSTNISATRSTITNMSSTDFNSTRSTITNMSCSNLSVSNKVSLLNLSGTNATFTSLTAPNVQPTLTAGTGITIVGTTISSTATLTAGLNISILNGVVKTNASVNLSNLNSSSGYIYALVVDNIESKAEFTEFITALEGEIAFLNCDTSLTTPKINVSNLSGTNATFTSLTAPNVQRTLTAGTNITIVGTTISSSGGGTTLVAGSNISILNGVIKTTSNVNLSNLSTNVLHSPVIVSNLITSIDGEIDILNADISVTTPFLAATNITAHNISAVNEIQALSINASNIVAESSFSVLSDTLSTSFYTDFVDDQKFVLKVTGVGGSFSTAPAPSPKLAFRTTANDALLITQAGNVSIGAQLTATNISANVLHSPVIVSNLITSIDGEIDILNADISVTTPFLAATNTSGTNASFTNMTVANDLYVNNLFNSTKNYGFLSRNSNQGLGTTTLAYPLYNSTGLFNTNLYTNVNNTEMRVLKAGYYRINAEAAFDNVLLGDRLTMRQRILINGSFSVENGYGLCYIRHNNFGNFGSVSLSTIVLLSVNDLIRQEYTVNIGNAQGFNSNFNNYITAVSQQLMVEFLG